MTERLAAFSQLRARRIAHIAAILSALGLLISISPLTTLNIVWFVVLLVCLAVSFARLRTGAAAVRAPQEGAVAQSSVPAPTMAAGHESSSFLSSVSHDLRQPLQAISLYAATLATHSLPDASQQLVNGLELAAETLSAQFEEVMAIAKLDSSRMQLDPKAVSLGAVLSSTVAAHLLEAHDKSLHLRHVATPLKVWADETLLAAVVDRLVRHAVQVTERGGVLIGCRRRGDDVLLEVRDTSAGIAPELQAEVFQPFSAYGQRLNDRALSLAFAQRAVQRLGGTLSLRSIPERGNLFTVRLPRLNSSAPA